MNSMILIENEPLNPLSLTFNSNSLSTESKTTIMPLNTIWADDST